MHPRLRELHQDHLNLAKVLHLLERQLDAVREGEDVDVDVLSEIVDYVQSYPDLIHHRRENVIFLVYLEHPACKSEVVRRLMDEHSMLIDKTRALHEDIEEWRQDSLVPRERIVSELAEYLQIQWDHMNLEEGTVFDLLNQELTDNDWERIETSLLPSSDPLFGNMMRQRFENIFDELFPGNRS